MLRICEYKKKYVGSENVIWGASCAASLFRSVIWFPLIAIVQSRHHILAHRQQALVERKRTRADSQKMLQLRRKHTTTPINLLIKTPRELVMLYPLFANDIGKIDRMQ